MKMLDAAKAEWGKDLSKYRSEEILKAIEKCKKIYKTPPSLPEFLFLLDECKIPSHEEYKRLPVSKSDKKHAREQLKNLKQILK